MKIQISNYAQINENESNEVQIKILLYIAGTTFELQKKECYPVKVDVA